MSDTWYWRGFDNGKVESHKEIVALKAEVERLLEAGNYLAVEVEDAWQKGRISIDTKNAAANWRLKALRGEGK
jgi:hypothetical protein